MCNDNPIFCMAWHTLRRISKCTGAVGLFCVGWLQTCIQSYSDIQISYWSFWGSDKFIFILFRQSHFPCVPHIPKFWMRSFWFSWRIFNVSFIPLSFSFLASLAPLHLYWSTASASLLAIYLQASSALRWSNTHITTPLAGGIDLWMLVWSLYPLYSILY